MADELEQLGGQIECLLTGFSQRRPMDFGVVDVASCMGQETHTIHLNFQVGLKAHLEERGNKGFQPVCLFFRLTHMR